MKPWVETRGSSYCSQSCLHLTLWFVAVMTSLHPRRWTLWRQPGLQRRLTHRILWVGQAFFTSRSLSFLNKNLKTTVIIGMWGNGEVCRVKHANQQSRYCNSKCWPNTDMTPPLPPLVLLKAQCSHHHQGLIPWDVVTIRQVKILCFQLGKPIFSVSPPRSDELLNYPKTMASWIFLISTLAANNP